MPSVSILLGAAVTSSPRLTGVLSRESLEASCSSTGRGWALAEAIEEEGPLFYLNRATLALGRIDIKNPAFEGQYVEEKIKAINDFTWEFKKALKEKLKNNE